MMPTIEARIPRRSPGEKRKPQTPDGAERFLDRTGRLLDRAALARLRAARLVIAGCGGVGGAVAVSMARLGVGHFVLADPGTFDEPDVNRQWAADHSSLGKNKAMVYADWLRRINPAAQVEVQERGVCADNVETLVRNADLVIDCLDISVDLDLRARLFQRAEAAGAYAVTAPVLGFGTFIAMAAPGQVPMSVFLELLGQASASGKLPPAVGDFYAPLTVEALERDLPTGRLPSLSIGPVLAGGLVSTEVLLALLHGHLPGVRGPICLPRVLMMDPVTARYQVAALADLMNKETAPAAPAASSMCIDREAERLGLLRATSFNTNLLPASAVPIDLLTDSWGEIHAEGGAVQSTITSSAEERLQEIYGYAHAFAVHRGRFAEALLAAALVKPGSVVASNALFPSTRFHIESRGATLVYIGTDTGKEIGRRHPVRTRLDLEALRRLLETRDRVPVSCVWIEACPNALGGVPVSLDCLRSVHELCRAGVPVVLDATRLIDNVILRHEADGAGRTVRTLLHEFTKHSDACALSAMKDFQVRHGGFVATHSPELAARFSELMLAYGSGLDPAQKQSLVAALQVDPFAAAGARVRLVRELHRRLVALDVPVLHPGGGHAVFVDAARLLPHLRPEEHPVPALAAELFRRAGVRGGLHFASPRQREQGRALLRLAVPVARYDEAALDPVVEVLAALRLRPEHVGGLKKLSQPPGALGEFLARYEPAGL